MDRDKVLERAGWYLVGRKLTSVGVPERYEAGVEESRNLII